MRKSITAVCIFLLVVLIGSFPPSTPVNNIAPPIEAADILKFNVPAVTHGFTRTSLLPDGDLFLLERPFAMAIMDPSPDTYVFPVNFETFGGGPDSIGALATTEPMGLSISRINSKVQAVTCAESLWDTNFLIASSGGAIGDTVRLFLQNTDGTSGPDLAVFSTAGGGAHVTSLHSDLKLFVNNRLATGHSWNVGNFIPYIAAAGSSGLRTHLLTLAWPMGIHSELQDCHRVGVEIVRGGNTGSTSVVITDIVVNRNRLPGDENNPGFGLLNRMAGGYPSGFPCKEDCPFPDGPPRPQNPGSGGQTGDDPCNAICFRSARYFLLNLSQLPRGTVIIGGLNFNRPVSTTNTRAMYIALRGGFTPLQQLNQEFVAAQLNGLLAGGDGSVKYFYAMQGMLSCYGLQFDPVTLDNGIVLTPESKLKTLYDQARFSIYEGRSADQIRIARIFNMLNGNNIMGVCNNQSLTQ